MQTYCVTTINAYYPFCKNITTVAAPYTWGGNKDHQQFSLSLVVNFETIDLVLSLGTNRRVSARKT